MVVQMEIGTRIRNGENPFVLYLVHSTIFFYLPTPNINSNLYKIIQLKLTGRKRHMTLGLSGRIAVISGVIGIFGISV